MNERRGRLLSIAAGFFLLSGVTFQFLFEETGNYLFKVLALTWIGVSALMALYNLVMVFFGPTDK